MKSVAARSSVYIVLATIVTLAFTWFSFEDGQMLNSLTVKTADTHEHLNPSDNFIDRGIYALRGDEPYAVRMPGYAFPYLPLRLFFPVEVARVVLVILQLLFYTWSILLTFRWLQKSLQPRLALAAVLVFVFFNYLNHIHFKLLPVSFAMSALLMLFYLHHRITFSQQRTTGLLFTFGLFATWLFFLRPFLGPILIVWMLLLSARSPAQTFRSLVLVFLPLVIIETAWITRNYMAFDRFVPLQTTFAGGEFEDHYKDEETKASILALRPFISGFGGDNVWYFPKSEMSWFLSGEDKRTADEVFPEIVFNAGISAEELHSYKQLIQDSYKTYDPVNEAAITAKARELNTQLKSAAPFHYHITARFHTLLNLFSANVTQDWNSGSFTEASLLSKGYRLICVALWFIVMSLGVILSLLSVFNLRKLHYTLLIWGMLFLFLYIVNFIHFQYFIFAYMAAFMLISELLGKSNLIHILSQRLRLLR